VTGAGSYVGRFAPTPSGPLHFGSIIAALASYLEARTRAGRWLIRFDDLDTPRVRPGAADNILRTLERFQLQWDGEVIFQSVRLDRYEDSLDKLMEKGLVYPCYCTRKLTKGMPYPGTCRDKPQVMTGQQYSLRIRTPATPVTLTDRIQGEYSQDLRKHSGDFILRRADDIIAYDLAAAVDDTRDGITEVIRGVDLLDSTPRHIYLQSLLGRKGPGYGHVPVAVDYTGRKISKRDGAMDALLTKQPHQVLLDVWQFLGQALEPGLENSDVKAVMAWALENWSLDKVPKLKSIQVNQ
jgi:glutamyl-Q tRNA(Asp) synthetase